MRNCKYLILLLLLPVKLWAQQKPVENIDITGLWKGTLYNDTTKQFYQYEIGISEEKGKFSGFSHTWFILDDKQYYGVKKVKIKKKDGRIIIEDDGLIANNYPVSPAKGVKQLNILTLEAADSIMTLKGSYTTNATKEYRPLTGTISLERKNDYWQSALVPHLQELNLVNNLSFVKDDMLLTKNNVVLETRSSADVTVKRDIDRRVVKKTDSRIIPITAPVDDHVKTPTQDTKTVAVENTQTVKTSAAPVNAKTPIGLDKKNTVTTSPTDIVSKQTVKISAAPSAVKEPKDLRVNKADTVYSIGTIPKQPDRTVAKTTAENKMPEKIVSEEKKVLVATAQPAIQPTPEKIAFAALDVERRTTSIQQTVVFKTDSLQLSLYDNGEVDGDTVSVLMNGNIIMAKERLSTNAVRKTIFIAPGTDSVQLLMYAENLGTIPPNTGLLVVKDGKETYEIRFSGDLQKNAAIIFKRKKE